MTDQTLIEQLAGIAPDSPIGQSYARRSDARTHAELSYQLLIHPETPGPVSLPERRAIAYLVAALYGASETTTLYETLLRAAAPELAEDLVLAIPRELADAAGPFGHYPAGPLSAEDEDGPVWEPSAPLAASIGPKLAAALAHAHMLALHPRDASIAALAALGAAGWDEDGVVVLSQIVAFVSFQIRVVTGLKALVDAEAA
ncbi:hypothetical protein BVG79_01023 [Ketogulonicigenium robustum]|uniref:CMD domain protein n=1 Tax=Ketogulonicigenium robustum TaxID=92947 RepID=A0A1W6NYV4_9RHOB|nr:CMD domain protein [Ketogulonicigenium robustum]ARO14369.1 hypothetical protein BVG79_01023 [Ketogulonicigenium robustum]